MRWDYSAREGSEKYVQNFCSEASTEDHSEEGGFETDLGEK